MEFEKILKDKIYKEKLQDIEKQFEYTWYNQKIDTEMLRDESVRALRNGYTIYIEKSINNISKKELYKLIDEFEEKTSLEALNGEKEKIQLQEQEEMYIKCKEQFNSTNNARTKSSFRSFNEKDIFRTIKW